MKRYKWDELDPFTQRQIELQQWDEDYANSPPVLKVCGCEIMRDHRWNLCFYHNGVQDGASEVRAGEVT